MNKTAKTILAAGLALAIATPALAEFKVSGFYRLMGYSTEAKSAVGSTTGEGYSQEFIAQRFRIQLANQLNDNVALVYQAEVDSDWGFNREAGGGVGKGLGSGGQLGTDGVNVETKHMYLDLKSGNTTGRLGLQAYADKVEGVVVNADFAGVVVGHKMGATTLGAIYSKFFEGDDALPTGYTATKKYSDDTDFYGIELSQKFSDAFNAGFDVYYVDNNVGPGSTTATGGTTATEIFYFGPRASFTTGNFTVDGFVVFQDGEQNEITGGQDVEGFVASAKAKVKIDKGDIGLRLIYITEDDDDDKIGAWQGMYDAYEFVGENLQQFLCDPFVTSADKRRYAFADAAQAGYGLMGAVVSGNHTLPDAMYVKWGVGYFSAVEDETNDSVATKRDGKELGYELAARVGKKFFEKVDVSANLSYADYGDFYTRDAFAADETPDATYQAYLMVNVPF